MLEAMVEHHRGLDPPKLTSMDLYFNRPMALLRMKFQEMFEKYVVQRKPKTLQNVNGQWMCGRPLRLCFHLAMLSDVYGRQIYLVARDPSKRAICRLEQGRLGEGEKWYLRIILLNRPIRSFEDAKLVNGVRYPTFQEAALRSNFIKDGDECLCAFREAQLINIPRQMRALFTILTLQGYPTSVIYNDPVLQRSMYDFDPSKNDSQLQQSMLEDIQRRLVTEGKSMAVYGLPMPIQRMTELEIHKLKYSRQQGRLNYQRLEQDKPFNVEQQDIFNIVTEASGAQRKFDDGLFYFMKADAGCGKTTVAMKLAAYFRSMGKIVLICASTALAAQNYPNEGVTAHYLFHLPVIDENEKEVDDMPMQCLLHALPERLELVCAADVIIWDEFPSNERRCFEAVYEHQQIQRFRGKVVIGLGDLKQILPVGQDRQDIINMVITSSPYWDQFHILELTINMRLQNPMLSPGELECQTRYANLIKAVGHNKVDSTLGMDVLLDEDDYKELIFSSVKSFNEDNQIASSSIEAIKWLYPNGAYDTNVAVKTTILAPTNKAGKYQHVICICASLTVSISMWAVDEWNEMIGELNEEEEREMTSNNWMSEVDDVNGVLEGLLTDEVAQAFDKVGIPPHQLKLKVITM